MSLGGNLSSGYTDSLNDSVIQASINTLQYAKQSDQCCKASGYQGIAVLPSMLLASKVCTPPTPTDFALYPKVAIPSSARTELLASNICGYTPDPRKRFAKYNRYSPAVPCQALPQSSRMAGISKPSTRGCNTTIQ